MGEWIIDIICFIGGMGLVEQAVLAAGEDSGFSNALTGILGFAIMVPLIIKVVQLVRKIIRDKKNPKPRVKAADLEAEGAANALAAKFTKDLKDFLKKDKIGENETLQEDTTQILYHELCLQKKRLSDKNITLEEETEAVNVGDRLLTEQVYCDGKYRITELGKSLLVKKTYLKQGKILKRFSDRKASWYNMIDAWQQGEDQVICPNCGNVTDRTNLIDGCDFCGTKFTVEDLGLRISEFGQHTDYRQEYSHYKHIRRLTFKITGLTTAVISGVLGVIFGTSLMYSSADESEGVLLDLMGVLFLVLLAIGVCEFLVYALVCAVFGVAQIVESAKYYSKKKYTQLNERSNKNASLQDRIREEDPEFSLNGFLAGVMDKIAAIHFADDRDQALAFAEGAEDQILSCLEGYRDVIDVSVGEIFASGYEADEENRHITVDVTCRLLSEKEGKISSRNEKLQLVLQKNAACRTQTICAPTFCKCKNCGADLPLSMGRKCSSCGSERKYSDVDWAVEKYEVKP